MNFTDNTTNKTYTIAGNTVTQQRNGVTCVPTTGVTIEVLLT